MLKKRFAVTKFIREFLALEATSGILMIITSLIALIMANSSSSESYYQILAMPVKLQFGAQVFSSSFKHLVNELLMFFFFMIVGLEIKKELKEGHLANKNQILLPLIATIAGVVMPAIVFWLINHGNAMTIKGWGIPIVTDIAFALAILSFFKKNIPAYLRVFILSIAIFDDLIGILVIALFYSQNIDLFYLMLAALITIFLMIYSKKGFENLIIYLLLGFCLWCFLLKSGVHATIAGVITALAVPLRSLDGNKIIADKLMANLHPFVSYIIVPIFAFTNAGITFSSMSLSDLSKPLPLGIILGLFIGKQLGVFGSSIWLIKSKLVKLPTLISASQLYGVSVLTGIGFTVSLFIEDLAFSDVSLSNYAKAAILIGSLLSAIWGFIILKIADYFAKDNN